MLARVTPMGTGIEAPLTVVEPSLGKRAQRKRATREGIVAAAERLFAERGYDGVTVADIAAAAGVSVKTLFVYFHSKEDLALVNEEKLLGRLLGMVRERDPGQTPLGAVTAALLAAFEGEEHPRGTERNEAVPCPETRLVAAQLIAVVRITTSPDALAFVREHRTTATEALALREWIDRSAAQLGDGLAEWGRRPGASA
jgi:AcrR family transcriptional regulator